MRLNRHPLEGAHQALKQMRLLLIHRRKVRAQCESKACAPRLEWFPSQLKVGVIKQCSQCRLPDDPAAYVKRVNALLA